MSLTQDEKETIVVFDEASRQASIFTYNRALLKKLREFSQKYPQSGYLVRVNGDGGEEYVVDKDRLSINLKRPRTEAEMERYRENAKRFK